MSRDAGIPWKALLVAVVISVAVAALRFVGQLQGWIATASGGGLHPLGIVWLPFVFGPLFAVRLAHTGSRPRSRFSGVVGLLVIVGLTMWLFRHLADAPPDRYASATDKGAEQAAFQMIFLVTLLVTGAHFATWWRLAVTLVCYAVPVRAAVVILTAVAKQMELDTHYTKFGTAGDEFDLATTLTTASIAQFGFWVPFSVVCGFATGSFFGRPSKPQE